MYVFLYVYVSGGIVYVACMCVQPVCISVLFMLLCNIMMYVTKSFVNEYVCVVLRGVCLFMFLNKDIKKTNTLTPVNRLLSQLFIYNTEVCAV